MMRLISFILLHLSVSSICLGQVKGVASNKAILITQTTTADFGGQVEKNSSKFLYTLNSDETQIYVYQYNDGSITTAYNYQLVQTKGGLYLISKRLFATTAEVDSLKLAFSDQDQAIHVGQGDKYTLFPANYNSYKAELNGKRQVLKLATLLSDNIGNYPIESLLPLAWVSAKNQFGKCIQKATITTQREQADRKDVWACTYTYNNGGKIAAVKAASGKDVRFSKTVQYQAGNIDVKSYQNIEDRQITNRQIHLGSGNTSSLKWTDHVVETGQDRETELTTVLTKKDLGQTAKIEFTSTEAINFINKIK